MSPVLSEIVLHVVTRWVDETKTDCLNGRVMRQMFPAKQFQCKYLLALRFK